MTGDDVRFGGRQRSLANVFALHGCPSWRVRAPQFAQIAWRIPTGAILLSETILFPRQRMRE